jgi:hypothetical protein
MFKRNELRRKIGFKMKKNFSVGSEKEKKIANGNRTIKIKQKNILEAKDEIKLNIFLLFSC